MTRHFMKKHAYIAYTLTGTGGELFINKLMEIVGIIKVTMTIITIIIIINESSQRQIHCYFCGVAQTMIENISTILNSDE